MKIGNLLRLSRNSIIPMLRDFQHSGCVEIGYGEIRIVGIAGPESTLARDA